MLKSKPILIVLSAIFFIYAGFIEPQWIEVTNHDINAPVEDGLKVVQISDLHTSGLGRIEKKVIEIVNGIVPDIIVLTGDVSSPGGTPKDYYEVLSQFKATKGTYFVHGNWEYWAPSKNFDELLLSVGVVNLDNKSVQLDEHVWLIGFDDALEGSPREGPAFKDVPSESYKIGIFHSPVYFNSVFEKIDVSLSGHTHGGQMRLPFVPPFWLPDGSSHYVSGWFSRGRNKMYVSRGIGTSVLPFRLFCRPEIAVFNFKKQGQ